MLNCLRYLVFKPVFLLGLGSARGVLVLVLVLVRHGVLLLVRHGVLVLVRHGVLVLVRREVLVHL